MERLSPTTSQDFISSYRTEITKVHHSLHTRCFAKQHVAVLPYLSEVFVGMRITHKLMLQHDLDELNTLKGQNTQQIV